MKKPPAYSIWQVISSVVMTLALLWATLSLPFVYQVQQEIAKEKTAELPCAEEENPFSNSTEEKSSSVSFTEEYLHHQERTTAPDDFKLRHSHLHSYDVYVAFHGELISPPPDSFLS